MAIKVLEQETCEDCISRQAVIDAIKKYKIPSEDCVSSIDKAFNDGIETAMAEIGHNVPSVNPQEPKTDILDKIRAEIQDSAKDYMIMGSIERARGLREAREIIDKYRKRGLI